MGTPMDARSDAVTASMHHASQARGIVGIEEENHDGHSRSHRLPMG